MPNQQEKAGRPKVLVRRHVLEIKEDTREFLDTQIDKILNRLTLHKGVESVSGFLTSLASHPAGLMVISAMAAYVGLRLGGLDRLKEGGEDVQISFWKSVVGAGGGSEEAQDQVGEAIRKANELARRRAGEIPGIGDVLDLLGL